MTQADAKIISGFIARTGMYVYPVDEHGIVSFIDGYEVGSQGRCQFTKLLAAELAEKHGVKPDCQGWNGQVRQLGERCGIRWTEAFILITSAVLTKFLDTNLTSQEECSG